MFSSSHLVFYLRKSMVTELHFSCGIQLSYCKVIISVICICVSNKDEWTDLDSMPHVRGDFCAGIVDGKIVVVGGMSKYCIVIFLSVQ